MKNRVKIRHTDKELFNLHNSYLKNAPLAKIVANRGIKYKLPTKNDSLASPFVFKKMPEAVFLFEKHLKEGNKIIVNYDYDNDGFSGALIFLSFIKEKYGIKLNSYVNKKHEGYELTAEMVQRFYDEGNRLLIIIDKGISSFEGITKAKELGMDVIVLDHHQPKKNPDGTLRIPPADVIIDHTVEDFITKENTMEICGAATAWYMCRAIDKELAEKYVDIAAVATIVDMVPMNSVENRIIVLKGLDKIKKGEFSVPAYGELLKECLSSKSSLYDIHEDDFAYILGPTINSICRYDKNRIYLEKILENRLTKEDIFEIIEINNYRKEEVLRILKIIEKEITVHNDFAFYKGKDELPEYLLGLIASKFSADLKKTVFIVKEDGEKVKGSGRSIGYDLQELFSERYSTQIIGGGHKNAIGFHVMKEEWDTFVKELFQNVKEETFYYVDGIVKNIDMFDTSMYYSFQKIAPYGVKFEKPLFLFKIENKDEISDIKLMKEQHLKFKYKNKTFLKFFIGQDIDLNRLDEYYFIVSLETNTFRNKTEEQFFVIDMLPLANTEVE